MNTVTDPILNDFLYTVLYNATYSEKRGLPKKYLKVATNQRSAKKFIENSTDEDKKVILSHLGYRFFWTFIKEDFDLNGLRGIVSDFEKDNKGAALKKIIESGLIVTSDKEFVRLLSFTARGTHHSSYFLDMEYKRQGFNIQKWKRRIFIDRDLAVRDLDESACVLAKTILDGIITSEWMKEIGFTQMEVKVLLCLYESPHISFSEEYLLQKLAPSTNKQLVTRSIKSLAKSGNIDFDKQSDDVTRYTINAAGTKIISEFFKKCFK